MAKKFVSVKNVRKGKEYTAYDSNLDKNYENPSKVKILSVKKDESGYYDVEVQYVDGEQKGKKDSWYLEPTDNVFTNEEITFGENKMSKKKNQNLDEGMIMLSPMLPVATFNNLRSGKKDNFEFKGLPGQFDEDGNKILDEQGNKIEEAQDVINKTMASGHKAKYVAVDEDTGKLYYDGKHVADVILDLDPDDKRRKNKLKIKDESALADFIWQIFMHE